jgi:hypothetical protein
MESKWPFMLIAFGLIFALGLTISGLERSSVIKNWDKRRCEIPVTMASMFFKPNSDPRSKTEFAKDNFNFCMGKYVDNFMKLLLAPINAIFGKHVNLTGSALDMINTIRTIATTLYNTLSAYLETFYRRFNASVYEISRVIQFLRMAMSRANAMVMSMLYTGITMFRGLINTIQFVIKVILIICGIMLAIIIILIFVLFPFIPMILTVLGSIVATVLALTMFVSGSIADKANSDKSGFCFSAWTLVQTIDNKGNKVIKPVTDIKLGDELANNCGKVTAIIQMDGRNIPLHYLNGIIVSGSHLVKGVDGEWKLVAKDERAFKANIESSILYCFNTTTNTIPIYSPSTSETLLFRDWEEISDNDERGQYEWNYIILKMLNNSSNYNNWKNSIKISDNIPLLSSNTKIKYEGGFISIDKINIGINNLLDSKGNKQEVLGIINAKIENVNVKKMEEIENWNTELFELQNNIWTKSKSNIISGIDTIEGMTIITESGEFIIWDDIENKERIIRDFTEVGYKTIHETYPFVASRLRTME